MPERAAALRSQRKELLKKREFQSRPQPFLGALKLVRLSFEKPAFESVCWAFDKVHGISKTPSPQDITITCDGKIAANISTTSMDHTHSQTSALSPIEKKRSFQIHKRTEEEKSRGLDKVRLSNYVRDFDEEWNDIEDILQHKVVGKKKSEKIKYIMAKGKDWDWRWIPAESVNPDLIEAYLQERDEASNNISGSLKSFGAPAPNNSIVVWNVRASFRSQMPLSELILEVARFIDLEEANRCAEWRFQNSCAEGAIKTWKRYRFGNRFIGYVSVNKSVHDDLFVWVEKEIREIATCGNFEATMDEACSSTDHTRLTPDTNDTCYETVKGESEVNQRGSSELFERVRDGQDFFEMLKSNVHVDPDVYSRAKIDGSLSHLIANLGWRTDFIWRQWKTDWGGIRRKTAKEEKTKRAMVNTPKTSFYSNSVQGGELESGKYWEAKTEQQSGADEQDGASESLEEVESAILTPASSVFGKGESQA